METIGTQVCSVEDQKSQPPKGVASRPQSGLRAAATQRSGLNP